MTGNQIEEGVASLKSLIQPFLVMNFLVEEVKPDSDTVPPTPPKATPHSCTSKSADTPSTQASGETTELITIEVTFKPRDGQMYGSNLFADRPAPDCHDTVPEHFVSNTAEDSSCWPSVDNAGDIGLHDFREEALLKTNQATLL